MARYKYQSKITDGNGKVISSGTVTVYLAGTTTLADVYAAETGGTSVNTATTDSNGYFSFWVDDTEYGNPQLFKTISSKTNFVSDAVDNIDILPRIQGYSPASSATDQGVTGTGTLKYYVDLIGTDIATITLKNNSGDATTKYTLTTSETIPANITLKFEPGAYLDGAGTLTFAAGAVLDVHPEQKCFSPAFNVSGLNFRSVKWWGAVGNFTVDGVDDYTAIMSAIAPNAVVYFPKGNYGVETKIVITDNIVVLQGVPSNGLSLIYNNISGGASDCIEFTTTDPTDSTLFGANCGIRDLRIAASANKTGGSAVKIVKHQQFTANGLYTSQHPVGVEFVGIRSNRFHDFYLSFTGAAVTDSAMMKFNAQLNSDTSYTQCWTSVFSDFLLAGGGNTDYGIDIQSADGLHFSNAYTTGFDLANIHGLPEIAGEGNGGVKFTNLYLDNGLSGAGATADYNFLYDAGAGKGSSWSFVNCTFNGAMEHAAAILDTDTTSFSFTECFFTNANKAGIVAYNSLTLNLSVVNAKFFNCRIADDGGGIIAIGDAESFKVVGCHFRGYSDLNAVAISSAATAKSGQIIGNSFERYSSDLYISGTFSDGYTQVGNVSDNGQIPDIINSSSLHFGGTPSSLGVGIYTGSGTPEGSQVGGVGSFYLNDTPAGGEYATYHKRTGTGNTGWEGIGTAL